ncbi:phospholipase A2 inhibitor and Ly6/PLAUR domain-containing protein-like [Python bivittatus]|uniref:Phospholipase A2 inhibitor and Ly6/PLAUR domain-containing protein-like n=1 Tax=Python bivittatus TaxID=176946 RepID=A0A9F2RBY1_PYTBI|nr:phospholipase A2 inhibitor and Ly6/PLAUR domain-containing protein-like [Python bivittatus]
MAARILTLCLLSSVLATVTPLKCQSCFASGGQCRNEDMKMMECNGDEDICASIIFRSTFTTPPLSLIMKRCSKSKECFQGYYSTTSVNGRYLQGHMYCCQTDNCNAPTVLMPWRRELLSNGLQCPGCFEENVDSCEGTQPVVCLGNEDQCVSLSANLVAMGAINLKYALKGCTTKNACIYPKGETQVVNGLFHANVSGVECENPMKVSGVWNNVNNS